MRYRAIVHVMHEGDTFTQTLRGKNVVRILDACEKIEEDEFGYKIMSCMILSHDDNGGIDSFHFYERFNGSWDLLDVGAP